jgi:hypothetical protein
MSLLTEVKNNNQEFVGVPAVLQKPGQFPQSVRNFSSEDNYQEYLMYCFSDNSKSILRELAQGEVLPLTEIAEYMESGQYNDGPVIILDNESGPFEMTIKTAVTSKELVLRFSHVKDQK